jgi:hypothetical protein
MAGAQLRTLTGHEIRSLDKKAHPIALQQERITPVKKPYRMILGALVLVASLWPLVASAAEVKNWEYKGHGQWTLQGQTTDIIYAQANVGAYPLFIMYAKPYDEWFMSFLYANDDGFPIMNEDGRRPTFFVRTSPGLGSGRYDTDYEIDRDAVVVNEGGFYQFSMLLEPQDIQALKRDLDMGADYWLDDGTKTKLWRTFRFPGTGAAAAIARIEAEIGGVRTAAKAPVAAWKTIHTTEGDPVGFIQEDEGDTSIGLRWIARNSWMLTFHAKPTLPRSIYMLGIPVPGSDNTRALSCGAEYEPDGDVRKCFGDGEAGAEGVITMMLDDDDTDLLARASFMQLETRGPEIFAVFSLNGSAAVIAEIKRYHKVAGRAAEPSEDLTAYHDRVRGLLDGFRFPDHLCTEPVLLTTLDPSQAELDSMTRNGKMLAECFKTAIDKDDEAIVKLVSALGGTISTSDQDYTWTVPKRCKCAGRVRDYVAVQKLRIDARVSANVAINDLANGLFDAMRSKNASDAKAAVARHNPIVAQIWPDLDAAVKAVSEDVRRIYERHGTNFNPPVFREVRYR